MNRKYAPLPPDTRTGLRCEIHHVMLVDGRGPDGKPEPSRYCPVCTELLCVDGVRALYVPKNAPKPAPEEEDLW